MTVIDMLYCNTCGLYQELISAAPDCIHVCMFVHTCAIRICNCLFLSISDSYTNNSK